MVNIKINNIITFINDDRKKSIFFFKDQSLLFIEAGNTNMIVITILFNCQTTLFLCFDNFLSFFFSSNYQKRCTSLLSTSLLYWIHQLFIIAYLFDTYFFIILSFFFSSFNGRIVHWIIVSYTIKACQQNCFVNRLNTYLFYRNIFFFYKFFTVTITC